jgi:hypothetical protein
VLPIQFNPSINHQDLRANRKDVQDALVFYLVSKTRAPIEHIKPSIPLKRFHVQLYREQYCFDFLCARNFNATFQPLTIPLRPK